MKGIFSIFGVSLFSIISSAQRNNPYNQNGIDYVKSLNIIQNAYDSGLVREFSEKTISYYSRVIPLQNQVSTELVATIVNTRSSANFNIDAFINGTSLLALSKEIFKAVIKNSVKPSVVEYKGILSSKVDEVLKSTIPINEREFVLSLIAMAYNVAQNSIASRGGCIITANSQSENAEGLPCIVVGAIPGASFGYQICFQAYLHQPSTKYISISPLCFARTFPRYVQWNFSFINS